MFEFLDRWLENFDNFNEQLVNYFLNLDDSKLGALHEVSTKVRKGAKLDIALSQVGLSVGDLRDLKPTVEQMYSIGSKLDLALHIVSFGVATGAEYYIDRRKNFSFTKVTLYYAGLYGFTSSVLQHQTILGLIREANEALDSFT